MASIPLDLLAALQQARSVVVLTGAGVSSESGIPTFRDALDGLWARYDPSELATPEAFQRDPENVARWYDYRRQLCKEAQPNKGHHALASLEARIQTQGGTFTLLTQNIDRLHQAAGSQKVVELHGTLWSWRCLHCGEEREEREVPFQSYPPRCACGGIRRPGVVWFGEELPAHALETAFRAINTCDVFFSIGTSALVHPAAGFVHEAKRRSAQTIEINLDPTPISSWVDWTLWGRSGELLPVLVEEAFGNT